MFTLKITVNIENIVKFKLCERYDMLNFGDFWEDEKVSIILYYCNRMKNLESLYMTKNIRLY